MVMTVMMGTVARMARMATPAMIPAAGQNEARQQRE